LFRFLESSLNIKDKSLALDGFYLSLSFFFREWSDTSDFDSVFSFDNATLFRGFIWIGFDLKPFGVFFVRNDSLSLLLIKSNSSHTIKCEAYSLLTTNIDYNFAQVTGDIFSLGVFLSCDCKEVIYSALILFCNVNILV